MVISTIMTTVAFFLPLAVGECRAVPTDLDGWSPAGIASVKRLVTLDCHHGEYNEVHLLLLGLPSDKAQNELQRTSLINSPRKEKKTALKGKPKKESYCMHQV